jgi:hypothetical protein
MKALFLFASLVLGPIHEVETNVVPNLWEDISCEWEFVDPDELISPVYPDGQTLVVDCSWPVGLADVLDVVWNVILPTTSDLSSVADVYNTRGNLDESRSWIFVVVP